MSIRVSRGATDPVLDQIIQALRDYHSEHPNAEIELYRQNSVSVRVRIVDADFRHTSRPERNRQVWAHLKKVPEETQSDISTLLLLTPDEKATSFANVEFEDPVPSRL